MSAQIIPTWESDDTWNTVGLGPYYLPGTWTLEGLEVGIDVDTKKAKGADGPTSTDNGLDAAKFRLVGQLTARDWPAFQSMIPDINPRRPGRDRAPIELLHQLTELLGIRYVRVLSIKIDPPTARDGIKVAIEVIEWFPAPKPTKTKKKDETPLKGPPAPANQLNASVDSFIEVPVLVYGEDGQPEQVLDPETGKMVPRYIMVKRPDPNGRARLDVLDYDALRRERGDESPPVDVTSQDAIMGNLWAAGNPGGSTP